MVAASDTQPVILLEWHCADSLTSEPTPECCYCLRLQVNLQPRKCHIPTKLGNADQENTIMNDMLSSVSRTLSLTLVAGLLLPAVSVAADEHNMLFLTTGSMPPIGARVEVLSQSGVDD